MIGIDYDPEGMGVGGVGDAADCIDEFDTGAIAIFVLPLDCAPTLNVYSRIHWSKRQKVKQKTYLKMLSQHNRRQQPLPGKPTIVAVRKSCQKSDQDSAWSKVWLDCLKSGRQGLNFIRDDDPDSVQVNCLWEYAPRNKGEVVIKLFPETKLEGLTGR